MGASRWSRFLFPAITAALAGCAMRTRPVVPPPVTDRDYIDLQPGWRIRAITPILKSGAYKPELKEATASGGSVQISAGDDFVGYETSYYSVRPGKPAGVVVAFVSAETNIDGKVTGTQQPRVHLFDFPASARYVRLFLLTRVSRADHNQAILAAPTLEDLNSLTERVRADPAVGCTSRADSHCEWVPEGIAVRPERSDRSHPNHYIPAR
jgi:hypothetical protein